MNSRKSQHFVSTGIMLVLLLITLGMGKPRIDSQQSFIVQGENIADVIALVTNYGGQVTSELSIINAIGAKLTDEALAQLQAENTLTIYANATVELVGNDKQDQNKAKTKENRSPETNYPNAIGADVVWEKGVLGEGTTVAIIDTGIANINGLKKDANNQNRIVGWVDFVESKNKPHDTNGHGTHIAGVIANSERGPDDEWNGIAPNTQLVGVRVLDEEGNGDYETVIQGIQWVLDHKDEYNIQIVNLSLVAYVQSPYWADPLNQAVMKVWAEGITVVVAGGNMGPDAMSIGVPGNNPYVITVGAFTDNYTPDDWSDDYITSFSAAGPTLDGFAKPDVVAPGAHIVSKMSPGSYLAKRYPENKLPNQYFQIAGTSQATAVVSGIAALTLSENPSLTPNQIKQQVMGTAFPWIDTNTTDALYSVWQQGAGRVNAPDAVFTTISGEANVGLDIEKDLAGTQHYEGFSYFDDTTGLFQMRGDFTNWNGNYFTWDGGYGTWAGGYGTWAGGYGTWAGGYGTWAGGYGIWAGGYGTWAGGYGTWAGGYGTWAGGYGTWAGGYGTWAGGYGIWAGGYGDTGFADTFVNWNDADFAGAWTQNQTFIGALNSDQ